MNAIVLAGGRGSRLMPLTENLPKPLLDVAGRPILDYVLSHLNFYSISRVVLSLGYKAEKIISRYASGEQPNYFCVTESTPLGTLGGVKFAERFLDDTFVVVSGDCLCNVDIEKMIDQHLNSRSLVTMAVTEVKDPRLYGVVSCDGQGKVISFHEKPRDAGFGKLVNMGIYVVNKSVLSKVPKGAKFDFSLDLFPMLLKERALGAYYHDGYWSDVGDIKSYLKANKYFVKNKFFVLRMGTDNEFYIVENGILFAKHIYGAVNGVSALIRYINREFCKFIFEIYFFAVEF